MSLNLAKSYLLNRFSDRTMAPPVQVSNIDQNTAALTKIVNRAPVPFNFIQSFTNSLSSNVSDGTMIIQSPVMNKGQRGVVEDFNVNFTTVAGTVRIVKVRGQDGLIIVDVTRGINSSASGTGSTVLEEGEAIAVVGQSAGAGTFSVLFSGKIQKVDVF